MYGPRITHLFSVKEKTPITVIEEKKVEEKVEEKKAEDNKPEPASELVKEAPKEEDAALHREAPTEGEKEKSGEGHH